MQQLSPKKYIETKARTLPLHRCLVNRDWEESKMASVIVMRRHTNGHVTAGIYLVDLLCLGVKDTYFIFNQPEEEITNRFPEDFDEIFSEIDYTLAHNIIYAGQDFAMDYDIHPHKDFATTRFILEEDNDTVPLIEIAVGDEKGDPMLVATPFNKYPEALAKLQKNAGEGNFTYITEEDLEAAVLEEEEEEEEMLSLDALPPGGVNCSTIRRIKAEDLLNMEKVNARHLSEQMLIQAQLFYLGMPQEVTDLDEEEEARWDRNLEEVLEGADLPNGSTPEELEDYMEVIQEVQARNNIMNQQEEDEAVIEQHETLMRKVLHQHSSNPLVVAAVYEGSIVAFQDAVTEAAREIAGKMHHRFPLLQLSLALGALVEEEERDPRFGFIYEASSIREAFPACPDFFVSEVVAFWLIRIWTSLDRKNIREALFYYSLVVASGYDHFLLLPVLARLNEDLAAYYEEFLPAAGSGGENLKENPGPEGGKIVPFGKKF